MISSNGQIRHSQGSDSSRICTVSSSVAELSVVGFYHSVMFLPVWGSDDSFAISILHDSAYSEHVSLPVGYLGSSNRVSPGPLGQIVSKFKLDSLVTFAHSSSMWRWDIFFLLHAQGEKI